MQSCLLSRLGKPIWQKRRISYAILSQTADHGHLLPSLHRFGSDASQGVSDNESTLSKKAGRGGIDTKIRRPSVWRVFLRMHRDGTSMKLNGAVMPRHSPKSRRFTPAIALAEYLNIQDDDHKKIYYETRRSFLQPSALPHILLHHLYLVATKEIPLSSFDRSFQHTAGNTLASRGWTMEDVNEWAWIISGHNADDMAERFFSSSSKKPYFLLSEILRRDFLKVKTLKDVLNYVSKSGHPTDSHAAEGNSQVEMNSALGMEKPTSHPRSDFVQTDISFRILVSRLLHQARRVWPPAMIRVSEMVSSYVESISNSSRVLGSLDIQTLSRISKLVNYVLRLLALPATLGPYRSMVHNWASQKNLLELAGKTEPPLVLDQNSYRAVIQVMAASKKSDRESRVSTLRRRSWPPWRLDQDGMDAQRSLEEDLSKVISAAARSVDSGYREDVYDEAMKVFGGQEPDGTPTIHTRKLFKRRSHTSLRPSFDEDRLSAQVWAARVEATRDVQEAWSAFTEYRRKGGKPHLALYLAMFQKLNYSNKFSERDSVDGAIPGDGREVMRVADNNFSDYYRVKLQPPPFEELYEQLIESGLIPQGRLLAFLVTHARTPDQGIRYLRDGRVNDQALEYLTGGTDSTSPSRLPSEVLNKIPDALFSAFIQMACRFAPRAVSTTPNLDGKSTGDSQSSVDESRIVSVDEEPLETHNTKSLSRPWSVIEMQPRKTNHFRFSNPLHHVAFLLRQRPIPFRPAWYALFKALGRPGLVISRKLVGDPQNDYLAWKVLLASLNEFHECGLELDPAGFLHVCRGVEKLATAFVGSDEHGTAVDEGIGILHLEFGRLSDSSNVALGLPYLHTVGGVHLHAYVRALRAANDYEGILSTLQWMVKNNEQLEETTKESRNGVSLVMRTMVAIRAFLTGTEYEDSARDLANKVEWWGGWPSEVEVVQYLEYNDRGRIREGLRSGSGDL